MKITGSDRRSVDRDAGACIYVGRPVGLAMQQLQPVSRSLINHVSVVIDRRNGHSQIPVLACDASRVNIR